jgi:DNA (cytosine-5)-methyltransferase 1
LFRWRQKYWSFLLKLHPKKPAPTIPATRITNNGPFHWNNRHLRIAELIRLQSFPDDYPVDRGVTGRTHLGNAVPPLLAAQLLWQLRHFLGDSRKMPDRLNCALDPTMSAPNISRALSVYYASKT